MARKTVFISDLSGEEINGNAAKISVEFSDLRKGKFVLDVTDKEADEFAKKGQKVARRGRLPRAVTA